MGIATSFFFHSLLLAMSNIYNLEPPTKGKVILKTSLGDLEVELWAKETPKVGHRCSASTPPSHAAAGNSWKNSLLEVQPQIDDCPPAHRPAATLFNCAWKDTMTTQYSTASSRATLCKEVILVEQALVSRTVINGSLNHVVEGR